MGWSSGPERSGGRPATAILPRDAKAAQPPAENGRGRTLREGDRDAVSLRSYRTHRGLRGRPPGRFGQEPDPGFMLIGGIRGHADGRRTAEVFPPSPTTLPCRIDRCRPRPAAPTASWPATAAGAVLWRNSDVGEVRTRRCRDLRLAPHHQLLSGCACDGLRVSCAPTAATFDPAMHPRPPGRGILARPAGRGDGGALSAVRKIVRPLLGAM